MGSNQVEAFPSVIAKECDDVARTILGGEPRLRIFLFGSRATGRGTARSDVDIGIDLGHPIAPDVMAALEERFDALPVLQKVDLVDFAGVDPSFRRIAFQATVTLHERDPG